MKHIFRIAILFLALFLTSTMFTIGLFNDMKNQINNIQIEVNHIHKELEGYKNKLSDINYDNEIADIYNKINKQENSNDKQEDANTENEDSNSKQEEQSNKQEDANNKQENTDTKDETASNEVPNIKPPITSYYDGIYEDLYHLYYGRLYIPDLNISVALYYGHEQYITDRIDSANIFFFEDDEGFTIADHNHQAFSTLPNIDVGVKGYIQNKYIGKIDIQCVDIFYGYNNGNYIIDENGANAMNRADYMMYTCCSDSRKVLICLWDIVK